MFENLRKFSVILSAVKASSITPEVLSPLLKMIGVQIDPALIPIITDVFKTAGKGKSLYSLLEDQKLMSEVESLLNITKSTPSDQTERGKLVELTTVIRCPHCNGAFSIMDAIGMREHIQIQNNKE